MMWRRRAVTSSNASDDEKVVVPTELSKAQFVYAYSLITSLFFAWGFAYGLLDSLNKWAPCSFSRRLAVLIVSDGIQALPAGVWNHENPVDLYASVVFRLVIINTCVMEFVSFPILGAYFLWAP